MPHIKFSSKFIRWHYSFFNLEIFNATKYIKVCMRIFHLHTRG